MVRDSRIVAQTDPDGKDDLMALLRAPRPPRDRSEPEMKLL
jgi:hypothetical protein